MDSPKANLSSVTKTYHKTWQTFRKYPAIFIPFIVFTVFESSALFFISFTPRMPLRLIFAPPIRTFWGERFMHYPGFFLLLPKLASLARMVLSIFIGSLLTGMAVIIIFDIYNKKQARLKESFKLALRKYLSFFTIILIVSLLFYLSARIAAFGLAKYFISGHSRLLFLSARLWLGPILLAINFMLGIFIQSFFIYAIPVLLIEKEKLLKSIIRSFVLFKRLFIPTILLIGLPMLIYLPIIFLNNNAPFLIQRLFPEFILLVLFLSIVITSLIIDPIVTISTAILYLENKTQDKTKS